MVLFRQFLFILVIPDLIQNLVFLTWIPAFAGMTLERSFQID